MRVERVGEVVGQGICGGDGAGHPAGGYCASMDDDWRVRAKGLVRELSGDGGADAQTAFRIGRVSYSYMLFNASSTQVFGGTG